ncbi:MAG: hypothetical protein U1E23_03550 [Reyranellaceae bacterium]
MADEPADESVAGDEATRALHRLRDPDAWARVAAATRLLPLRPDLAVAALEEVAGGPLCEAQFCARIILQEWQAQPRRAVTA